MNCSSSRSALVRYSVSDSYLSVCAVMVTYNPSTQAANNIALLSSQVGALVIVDNGSVPDCVAMLRDCAAQHNAILILNGDNLGVAAALNFGLDAAKALGFLFTITFDQDSCPPSDLVTALLLTYREQSCLGKVGIVAPSLTTSTGTLHEKVPESVTTVITSGSLIPLSVIQQCGGFEEPYFIDYIDHEFCLRIKRYGYRVVQCRHVYLTHELGKRTYHSFFGATTSVTNHSPSRRYYGARNRVITYKRFVASDPGWVFKDAFHLLMELAKIVLFEREVTLKLSMVGLGMWHGVLGKGGALA